MDYCVKCKKEPATYVSPDQWCDRCWAEWWVDGLLEGAEGKTTPMEREALIQETMYKYPEEEE